MCVLMMLLWVTCLPASQSTALSRDNISSRQPKKSPREFIRELEEELENKINGQAESPSHDPAVKKLLIEEIRKNGGTLSFPDFFDKALYSPDGYYQKHIKIPGDFSTYSEKYFFAVAIKEQLYNLWGALDLPERLDIVEVGAGNGTLAKNILTAARKDVERAGEDYLMRKMFFDAIQYTFIDISTKFTVLQNESMKEFKDKVSLRKGNAFDMRTLPDIENGIFLSNELVDQFPIHILRMDNGTFKEVYVAYNELEDSFEDILVPLSNNMLKEYVDRIDLTMPDGYEIAVNFNIDIWQEQIARKLKNGFVLTVDYGGKLVECIEPSGSAVWGTKGRRHIRDLKTILNMCGVLDMTSNVTMPDIVRAGQSVGLVTVGYQPQSFLLNQIDDEMDLGVSFDTIREWNADHGFKILLQATRKLSDNVKQAPYFEPYENSKGNPFLTMVKLNVQVPAEEDNYIVYTIGDFEPLEIDDNSIFGTSTMNAMERLRIKYGRVSYGGKVVLEPVRESDDGVSNVRIEVSRTSLDKVIIYDEHGNELFNGKKYFEARKDQEAEIGVTQGSYDRLRRGLLFDLNDLNAQYIPQELSLENGQLHYIVCKTKPRDLEDHKVLLSA